MLLVEGIVEGNNELLNDLNEWLEIPTWNACFGGQNLAVSPKNTSRIYLLLLRAI